MALSSVRTNAMRSLLTCLGIVIGVATVIGMLSIVAGINGMVTKEFGRMGASSFLLQKYPAIRMGSMREYRSRPSLTVEDAKAILASCPSVELVSPEVGFRAQQARSGNNKTEPDVVLAGVTSAYSSIAGIHLVQGRNFTPIEDDSPRNVAILGQDVVERLFPYGSPIGRTLRIGPYRLHVVGVLEKRGSMFGQSQDNIVAMPLVTLLRRYNPEDNLDIAIRARPDVPVETAMHEVRSVMRVRHKLKLTDPDSFEFETKDSLVKVWANLTGAVFAAAVGIAGISLLVGGVGIMNIMLVSVRERTREIGVRKALGARPKDISRQFLIEASVLSLLGGVAGTALGVGGLKLTTALTDALPVEIWASSVVLALGFSVLVGVCFGYFPARKAAKLNPIEALRYE
jgi:putative ABC transport system permease protein